MESKERLYRNQTEKVIGGVCGGLADYFAIDVVLARIAFVLLALFGGGGVLIYIVLWIVIPSRPISAGNYKTNKESVNNDSDGDSDVEIINDTTKPARNSNTGLIAGIVLILLGVLFLGDRILPWYNITDLWPLILVIIGVLIIKPDIFKSSKKQNNEV